MTDSKTSISNSETNAVKIMKADIHKKVEKDQIYSERIAELQNCQAEQLLNYNRRENIKIINIPESNNADMNGCTCPESVEAKIEEVLDVTKIFGAKLEVTDISITLRLQASGIKPLLRFSRRVAKIEVMRKKRHLYRN